MQTRLEKWSVIGAALVTIIGFPLLLVSLWFAHRVDVVISEQLGAIKKIAQSENGIALNTMLFHDRSNAGITTLSSMTSPFWSKTVEVIPTWSWTSTLVRLTRLSWCTVTAF
jgi:hypothetical protein